MQSWQIAIVLKPFVLLLMFAPGACITALLRRHMPHCRLKNILLISWSV